MKVPDARSNLVPDTWTADGEGALPKLSPCPHDSKGQGHAGFWLFFFGVRDAAATRGQYLALNKA